MGELPASEDELIKQVLQQSEARYNSADLNIAYKMVRGTGRGLAVGLGGGVWACAGARGGVWC